jgi:glucoamylase
MPKSINLGNGSVLIGLDKFGQVKDLYYSYPGLENHVSEGLSHKIGFFVDGLFSWLDSGEWNIVVSSKSGTMASSIDATNNRLGISLLFNDVVYNERNVFIRKIEVRNDFDHERKIKIFFNQQFNISQTHTGDTAYFDPRAKSIIHYKGRRVFLVNMECEGNSFSEYSIGLLGIEGKMGTYMDAEDGNLSGNAIEHGQVDSVVSLDLSIGPKTLKTVYYWIAIGKSIEETKKLNEEVFVRGPDEIIKTTQDYWKAWAIVRNFNFYGLSEKAADLFKKSLFYMRTHTANNGAIIASGDSEMLQFGRDYYEYVWPRDGAYAAIAYSKAGDFNSSKSFFKFCKDVIADEGYFMHKYRPDKALGSSWHPWVREGQKQFPIQEDETSIVIFALWKYYELSKDLDFVEKLYNKLIKKAAEFMVYYRDGKTGLPKASYDLWEQDYGISTYTAASVYGGLVAAKKFAKLLGKSEDEQKWNEASEMIKKSILKYLFDPEQKLFYKSIDTSQEVAKEDKRIDSSSFFGLINFGVLDPNEEKTKVFLKRITERLTVKTDVGGMARFEGDLYHHLGGDYPGNPWVITTLWIAQYYIMLATNEKEMEEPKKWIDWAVKLANPAGVLPEQFNPYTGEHLSASPLVWSHAEYIVTVVNYLEKLEKLGICKSCYIL